jgi:hypothetical protein
LTVISRGTRLSLEVLAAAAGLGVASDLLLRATPWGLNAFLATLGLVAAAAWLLRRAHAPVTGDAPWLAAVALLLASNFVARDSHMLRAFDAVGLVIVGALACLSLRGVALRGRSAWEYARAGVTAAAHACSGIFPLLYRDIQWRELPSGGAWREARAVAVGAALAFPLLLVFGGLFASADAVFASAITGMFDVDFAAVASHTLLIAFWTALAAGYLRRILLPAAPAPAAGEPSSPTLGIVPVATLLGLLDLLFLVFVVVQLRYFFGGADLVQRTTGLTYAEYARRGFFELVAASALVLPILLGADWDLRGATREQRRTFRHLAGLLLALLAVVMASALERMRLYVGAFGLSEIRLYATAFMLYLALVFAWFAWTTLRERSERFALGAVGQGFAVLAALHLVNPDACIVRTNLTRPATERPFDGRYAASLSADAVPPLLDALPRLDARARCGAADGLLARWRDLETDDWRNWNLSRAHARRLPRDNAARLAALACSVSPG